MSDTASNDYDISCCCICGVSEYHKHDASEMYEDVIWRDNETGEYWNFGMEDE